MNIQKAFLAANNVIVKLFVNTPKVQYFQTIKNTPNLTRKIK